MAIARGVPYFQVTVAYLESFPQPTDGAQA